jgi:hypothetical protein
MTIANDDWGKRLQITNAMRMRTANGDWTTAHQLRMTTTAIKCGVAFARHVQILSFVGQKNSSFVQKKSKTALSFSLLKKKIS